MGTWAQVTCRVATTRPDLQRMRIADELNHFCTFSSSICFCISYQRESAFTNFPITYDSVKCCHCEWLERRERAISSISNNFSVGSSFVPIRTLSRLWSKDSEAPGVFKLEVSTKERQAAPGDFTRKRMSRSFPDFRADDKNCQAFKCEMTISTRTCSAISPSGSLGLLR